MNKFWNWIRDADTGGRVLRLEGPIDEESFWGDEITPGAFREELEAEEGDVTVWINSPGGNVFAAAEIYTMLKEYAGTVTVKIASIAASAASVVAMAGDLILMSPTALLMLHDPSTIAMGNTRDMEKAIATLNEVKESIINAYMAKSGLSHNKISKLMENETWINAKKAVELGLADEIMYEDKSIYDPEEEEKVETEEEGQENEDNAEEGTTGSPVHLQMDHSAGVLFSTRLMGQTILNKLGAPQEMEISRVEDMVQPTVTVVSDTGEDTRETPIEIGMDGKTKDGDMPFILLMKQLEFLK